MYFIENYIKELAKEENKAVSVEDFLNNEENRKETELKAISFWNLLTHNSNMNNSNDRVFTKSEVVKRRKVFRLFYNSPSGSHSHK